MMEGKQVWKIYKKGKKKEKNKIIGIKERGKRNKSQEKMCPWEINVRRRKYV